MSEPVKLYSRSAGNPANPAIVLVHGFPYDSSIWDAQTEALKNDYFVVTYDVRGLGKSPAGDGQSIMDIFADDLFAVLKEYNLSKPAVAGFSMGGYILMKALEKQPDAFSSVIFCNTKSESDGDEARLKRNAGIMKINTEGLESFVSGFITATFSEDSKKNHPQVIESFIKKAASFDPVGVKGALLAMISRTDTGKVLENLKVPALVIAGAEDALMPVAVLRSMAERIPDSVFTVIEKAAHMTPVEQPEAVNKAISEFLRNQRRG